MLKANTAVVTDSYLDLIREFPLRSIRSERELDAAQAVLDRLLRSPRDAGSEQYLGALTQLVEVYEHKTHPIPDGSEANVLRTLMSSNDLTQSSLARQVGISQSTISAVLAGTRTLTKDQIVLLADYFHLSPAAFLPSAHFG